MTSNLLVGLISKNFESIPIFLFILFSLFLSIWIPFVQDENFHSIIIYEQTSNPLSVFPKLFNYPISWKPFLFFWIYAPFYSLPFSSIIALRIPSILFGVFSLLATKSFLKNLGLSQIQIFGILSVLITSVSFIYSGYAIHSDMLTYLLVILALYFLSKNDVGFRQYFLVAFLSFVAVFIKTIFAFLIPFLCFFYFFFYDRKKSFSLYFALILFSCVLGFIVHFTILEMGSSGLGTQSYYVDFFLTHLVHHFDLITKISVTLGGFYTILQGQMFWFVLSIFGFAQNYKKYPFFSVWYLLCIPLIISQTFTPWYFLYVILPIAFFTISFLSRIKKDFTFYDFDNFEKIIFSLFFLCSFILFSYHFFNLYSGFENQKVAGEFLANKENVLIIGDYAPGIIGHKMHSEIKSVGKPLDFGWFVNANQSDFAKNIPIVYYNYSSEIPNTQTGSFTDIYFVNSNFRKESNITHFRYVAFVNNENPIPNGTLLLNLSEGREKILIYEFPQLNSSLK